MLCFSYHFFVNSFIRRHLLKYTSFFFFHVLHKFNFNILQVLQTSAKYIQDNLLLCVSYGLFVWHSCQRRLFDFTYSLMYSLLSFVYIFELDETFLFKSSVRMNVDKLILYIYTHCCGLNAVYSIYQYLKLAINLRKKYIYYTRTFVFPIKHGVITLLRSPHIDKKARDQFAHISYKSMLRIGRVPMYLPFFTSKYLQHASNFSFKVILGEHYIYG